MPIYEYQCNACHHAFDKLQKMSDAPLKKCPECGQDTVDKLVSAAGFQLKGTGWYVTDFKDKPKPKDNKSDQASDKKSPAKPPPTAE
jgi:putative FmdB family regulatory protein